MTCFSKNYKMSTQTLSKLFLCLCKTLHFTFLIVYYDFSYNNIGFVRVILMPFEFEVA